MRPPQISSGDYTIKYKQVPHDDRYFILLYQKKEFARIPSYLEKKFGRGILPITFGDKFPGWGGRWYNFIEKVEQYNKYLDQ